MDLNATYHDGRLVFDKPVRFKNRSVSVRVSVPDDALDLSTATSKAPQEPLELVESESLRSMIQRLRQIRGTSAKYQHNGRTDAERFSEELELFYR